MTLVPEIEAIIVATLTHINYSIHSQVAMPRERIDFYDAIRPVFIDDARIWIFAAAMLDCVGGASNVDG